MVNPLTEAVATFRAWCDNRYGRMWSEDVWPRAFWFDAFLSHKRRDWSSDLATELGTHGLVVYHDSDVDVRDAHVEFELDAALRHSRFVIVCATPGLSGSRYCPTEYGPALKHSGSLNVPRVLVAQRDRNTPLPLKLAAARVFDVADDAGVATLADFIAKNNRVTFPQERPAALAVRAVDVFSEACTQRLQQLKHIDEFGPDQQKEFALREIGLWAQAVLDGSIDKILDREQSLGAARACLVEGEVATQDCYDYVWRCAFVMMTASHGDPIEIGTELFLWVARHDVIPHEGSLIIQRIWSETTLSGYPKLCGWLLDRLEDLPERDADAIERAAVTYPQLFSGQRRLLVSLASPAAQSKVDVPGLARNQLPPGETIHLICLRIRRLQDTWFAGPHLVGLFDVDTVLRELRDESLEALPTVGGELLGAYEIAMESKNGRPPLVMRIQLPELIHLVYRPLVRVRAIDPIRVSALL